MKHWRVLLVVCVCLLLCACEKKCEHVYQEKVTVEPSCTAEGEVTYTCTLCQESYKEPVAKAEHAYGESQTVKEATCSEEGEIAAVCKACGDQKFIEKIPVNNVHRFEEKTVRAATCTKKGEGVKTCTLCQHGEECEYEALGHKYGEVKVTKEPTCTKKGSQETTCTVCGKVKKENIKATGHTYKVIKDSRKSEDHARICVKKCETCDKEKTVYYGDNYSYDLDEIRDTIAKYAKSKGVKVAFSGNKEGSQEHVSGIPLSLIDLAGNGQKKLIEMIKSSVDAHFPENTKNQTLIFHITYSDNVYGSFAWSVCYVLE